MTRKPLILGLALGLAGAVGIAAGRPAGDSADTATQYLKAWSFKDYDAMYSLSAASARQGVEKGQFYRAAAALPVPSAEIQIVSRATRDGREHIYFESGSSMRGSIVVGAGGVEHPELLAAAQSGGTGSSTSAGVAQLPANPTSTEPTRTIDGETVDTILAKMTKATEAAETLQADVSLRGSMMGQALDEKGTLSYRAPDKFRMNFKSFTLNADGAKNLLYIATANVYLSLKELGDFELSPGIGMTGDDLKDKYSVALVGKGTIQGVKAFQLSLKPPENGLTSLVGGGTMKLWINAQTWLPLRAEMSSIKTDYTNMRVNAPGVTDDTFVFAPPKDATELSLGGLLGAAAGNGAQ